MKKLLFFVLIAVMVISCNCNDSVKEDQKTGVTTSDSIPPGGSTLSADLPNTAFYCMEATAAQVDEWLTTEAGGNRYRRVVFDYYWEDRTSGTMGFTLVGYRSRRTDRHFDPTPYQLTKTVQCTPEGIGNSITLSGQQVSIDAIRRLWNQRTGAGPHSLKFTPVVNAGTSAEPCNCPNFLVYKIDLIGNPTVSGGDAIESEYTNPSPPKPPSD